MRWRAEVSRLMVPVAAPAARRATGTRGDRGLTTPSIGRRSVGEADVRVSSTEAWPGVTVILGPHIRGSPRRRAGRESAGHGGWCPGPVPPRRRDARPLPRVTPRPAGGDDPLETAPRRQGPTPRPQAAAHHFGRHPPRVPAQEQLGERIHVVVVRLGLRGATSAITDPHLRQ